MSAMIAVICNFLDLVPGPTGTIGSGNYSEVGSVFIASIIMHIIY